MTLHWLRDDGTMSGHANDPIWDTFGFWRSSQDTYAPLACTGQKMHQTGGRSSKSEGRILDVIFCTWRVGPCVDDAHLILTLPM